MKRSHHIFCLLIASFAFTSSGCAGLYQFTTQRSAAKTIPRAAVVPIEADVNQTKPKKIQTVAFEEDESTTSDYETSEKDSLDTPQSIALESYNSNNSQTFIKSPEFHSSESETLTLAALEQMAVASNPAISASLANIEKSRGLLAQVGTSANPILGYFGQQLADEGTAQNGFYINQEIIRGNKLALNQEVLRHTTHAQTWELESQKFRVLTDIRVAFYAAIVAQKELDAIAEFSTVANKGVDFAEKRLDAGEGTKIEVLQSQTLRSEINLAREQAMVAYRGAWQTLVAVAGIADPQPVRLSGEIIVSSQLPNWDSTYYEIMTNSPELKVAQEILAEKQAFLQRQLAQAIPNWETQIGAGYDSATNSGMLNLQIGAPIPMRNKNCGNIAAARSDVGVAMENVRRLEQSIKSRLATAAQEYDAANAAVQKYTGEIIPQAEEAMALSEEGYVAGELEFLQTLVIRRSYYDATIKLAQAQGKLATAEARINGLLLSGGLDAHTDYTSGDGLRGQSLGGQ